MAVLAFLYFIFLFVLAQFIVCGQGFYVKLIYVLISIAAPLIGLSSWLIITHRIQEA